jgi:transposase-like protein
MVLGQSGIKRPDLDSAAIADAYRSGQTTVEIAARYGVHHVAINKRLRRMGVTIRPARRRALHDRSSEEIVTAYDNGNSMADIAREYGVTHSTVQRTLAAAGVTTRPHGLRSRSVRIPAEPVSLGYLCGLFDGEGNLQIRTKHRGRSVACKLSIYSTTPGIIQWLIRHIGGKALYSTKRTETKGWLPIGTWNVYRAQDAAALLKAMLPHLIVKKRVAEHALTIFAGRFKIHDSPPTMIQPRAGEAGGSQREKSTGPSAGS